MCFMHMLCWGDWSCFTWLGRVASIILKLAFLELVDANDYVYKDVDNSHDYVFDVDYGDAC